MTIPPDNLTEFRDHGATVLRGVIPAGWLARLEAAVDRVLAAPGSIAVDYTPPDRPGRFYNDFFLWLREPEFAAFIRESPLPALAAALLGAARVGFFFDQLFVKEPRTQESMPWHQDLPYWPVSGDALVTMWVPLDVVTRESGAVVYARGSHRWGRVAKRWRFARDGAAPASAAPLEAEEIRDASFMYWDMQPGDVLVHHPLTVHASGGNATPTTRRRALALRYFADGCVYEPREGDILQNPRVRGLLPELDLVAGEPLRGAAFPIVWPPEVA
ncbi:phytanoyl-CoA dioxygenase family protein [Nannocystis sp. ILAH1]|uniref:phytanoyl-CoA dioxygenase family protein n=1 Tax=unclassified Nannocystis TaxID=2627009 RepID=UPI0022721D2D|nr:MULTISPECIES: phytanoyl-CoA dioxygenase family protein [unclassified Nannocystis]MCY0992552.1 phytanoyl-CoA dioxygenase family protein [Nannocystis sp. ILAH1]MCY1070222.1 phytanoyl-CoA dioxygenase family protein [Nannocystis sp. RBIL2]